MNMTTKTVASFPASYPLGTIVEAPAEWMIDVMADLYQAEIVGSHGFGIRHPRAPWLKLVVSDRAECWSCNDLARWEEGSPRVAWCSRCAEAEVALVAAEDWRRSHIGIVRSVEMAEYETEPTVVEPFVRDADLPRPAALTLLCALVLAMLSAASGCATSSRTTADAPETVGNLSASYRSIAVAPVHASTDLAPSFGAVDTDEDAAPATVSAPADGGGDVALPEVAPKADGVTTGAVR